MKAKTYTIAKSIIFACSMMLNLVYAQTFNYGTGNVSGNLEPYASGNANVNISGNNVVVTGNTTIAAGTYNFANFTINSGVTLTVTGTGAPLIIRCTGTFTNNGILSANGGNGTNGNSTTANMASGGIGVAGGTNGGNGGGMSTSTYRATRATSFGTSSGGGWQPCNSPTGATNTNGQYGAAPGGGGGYFAAGSLGGTQYSGNIGSGCATRGNGGSIYGNADLTAGAGASMNFLSEGNLTQSDRWIIAGSGGGGGGGSVGSGSGGGGGAGGAGGGAIQIIADHFIAGANGVIRSRGGNGGTGFAGFYGAGAAGGGGSGGTIHIAYLSSYTMNNSNAVERIDVRGGNGGNVAHSDIMGSGGSGGAGSVGRFLVEEDEVVMSCTTVEGTDVINSCLPYLWIDGNTYSSNNNTATFLLEGAAQGGCDSLVTLNLTIWPCIQLQPGHCNSTNVTMDQTLRAVNMNAPAYRFRITGPNNGGAGWNNNTFILDRPNRALKFSMVPGSLWVSTYSVEVAVGDGNGNFGPYGNACNVSLTSAIPTTQLQAINCGATNVSPSVNLLAATVSGATGYRYRVNGFGVAPNTTIEKTMGGGAMRKLKMQEVTGIMQGETYTVEVAIRDAAGNWGAYGFACEVTLMGAPDFVINNEIEMIQNRNLSAIEFGVSASHNPFTTSFSLQVLNANDSDIINISIYDMSGKLIESNIVNPMDIESAKFGMNLAAGMYMIEVKQGSNQTLIRQVKN